MFEQSIIHEETVQLVGVPGIAKAGLFTWDEMSEDCTLTLRYEDKEVTATDDDYFEALCSIRKSLKADGLMPYCYGASRNAFPSGMSRGMGSGLQVYKLKLGEPAKTEDLVSLFASGSDVEPSTVAEQRAFFDDWLESLRRRTV